MGAEPPPVASGPRRIGLDGELEIFVTDEQTAVDVDVSRYFDLSRAVLEAEGVSGDVEFALLMVDEEAMTALNSTHMGGSGPTDVLAFPIDDELFQTGRSPDAGSRRPMTRDLPTAHGPLLLGDVVVCPAVAMGQAAANVGSYPGHDGSLTAELDLLVVHGILHVLGHDHARDDEREIMQAAERRHLAALAARR